MPPQVHVTFDVEKVPLEGRNLIEASAGTGKTYSIAVMVLRLLLERRPDGALPLRIEQILMVTFTNFAVAELELRVRHFIHSAYTYCVQRDEKKADPTIRHIVDASLQRGDVDTETLLKTAKLSLDQVAVFTIHGFCQRVLNEFAFDTRQVFGANAVSAEAYGILIQDIVKKIWREKITVLQTAVLSMLDKTTFTQKGMIEAVKKKLAGKFLRPTTVYTDDLDIAGQQRFLDTVQRIEAQKTRLINEIQQLLNDRRQELEQRMATNQNAKGLLQLAYDNIYAFLRSLPEKKDNQYYKKYFTEFHPLVLAIETCGTNLDLLVLRYQTSILQYAIDEAESTIDAYKERYSLLFFDDMIKRVEWASERSERFCEQVRKQYKAVFIDEFQDTDRSQYEAFGRIFGVDTILMYIGDPKQSIYGFRKADIFTYFRAREHGVDHIHLMNRNYRSHPRLIEALNLVFKPENDFDTFLTAGDPANIAYHPVEPTTEERTGRLIHAQYPLRPIIVCPLPNKNAIAQAVCGRIVDYVRGPYYIEKDNHQKRVQPGNIAVLVRSNKDLKAMKICLSSYGIPAVCVQDETILKSEEAQEWLYILEAVSANTKSNIHKALLTTIAGYSIEDVLTMNEEQQLIQFQRYQQSWKRTDQGMFVMMQQFISDHAVRSRLLSGSVKAGDRIFSNLLQLGELLHALQTQKKLSCEELIAWLKRSIQDGEDAADDAYKLRIESEENAVKLITIHKSKGLEFDIVIAPYLDFIIKQDQITDISFRDMDDETYCFSYHDLAEDQWKSWYEKQRDQEYRRLFYVALTRAKYTCVIFSNTSAAPNAGLHTFAKTWLNVAKQESHPNARIQSYIEWTIEAPPPNGFRFSQTAPPPPVYKQAESLALTDLHWRKMSYSGLKASQEATLLRTSKADSHPYDVFIFQTLTKGAATGNFLHHLFEHLDFTADAHLWEQRIRRSLERIGVDTSEEGLINQYVQLLDHLLEHPLPELRTMGSLRHLPNEKRLNEFEFDFGVKPFSAEAFNAMAPSNTPWQLADKNELHGIMNGKVDLFFEADGRYFILDWKSNHLGYGLDDYSTERVWTSMRDNNYHLQYHIYTVAVYRYLTDRLGDSFDYDRDFGGVYYLFIRGIRKGEKNGVFYHKPEKALIEQLSAKMGY